MAKQARRVRKTSSGKSSTNSGKQAEPSLTAEQQFRLEYAYVVKDLRRVFMLAAAMFLLLIVLNLVF